MSYPKLDMSADMKSNDARMYLAGALVYKVDIDGSGAPHVTPYRMEVVNREEYDEHDEPEENPDWSPTFVSCGVDLYHPNSGNYGMRVSGGELLTDPSWIVHRLPIDYVPLDGGTHLTRVTVEPEGRRAFKGMREDTVRALPLSDTPTVDAPHVAGVHRGWYMRGNLATGVAEVLSVGTPACMRRLVSEEKSRRLSALKVRSLFESDSRRVVVPDFPVAVIRHRTRLNEAYVLNRGQHIGNLYHNYGELTYEGRVKKADRFMRKRMIEGQTALSNRLFCATITWS